MEQPSSSGHPQHFPSRVSYRYLSQSTPARWRLLVIGRHSPCSHLCATSRVLPAYSGLLPPRFPRKGPGRPPRFTFSILVLFLIFPFDDELARIIARADHKATMPADELEEQTGRAGEPVADSAGILPADHWTSLVCSPRWSCLETARDLMLGRMSAITTRQLTRTRLPQLRLLPLPSTDTDHSMAERSTAREAMRNTGNCAPPL